MPRRQNDRWIGFPEQSGLLGPPGNLLGTRANREVGAARRNNVRAPMNHVYTPICGEKVGTRSQQLYRILRMQNIEEQDGIDRCSSEIKSIRDHITQNELDVLNACLAKPRRGCIDHGLFDVESVQRTTDTLCHRFSKRAVTTTDFDDRVEALVDMQGVQNSLNIEQRFPIIPLGHATVAHFHQRNSLDCESARQKYFRSRPRASRGFGECLRQFFQSEVHCADVAAWANQDGSE